MATAESLAQIKAVMQEEDNPVEIVVLAADGTSSELVVDHRKIREVLGSLPTFVGSIRKLDVSAVARKDGVGKNNKHVLPKHWDEGIKGTIVLFRTVEEGAMFVPKPFRLADYEAWRAAGGVEEEVEEEDEEDEEGEDGDEDEDEDSGEESDGEEGMDMEQMAEQMASLPEKELKKMLKDMELPVTGTVSALAPSTIASARARPSATQPSHLLPPHRGRTCPDGRSRTCPVPRWGPPSLTMHCRRAESGAGRAHPRADEGGRGRGGGGGGGLGRLG